MKHSEDQLEILWEEARQADKAYRKYCDENGIDPNKMQSGVSSPLLTEISNADRVVFDKALDLAGKSGAACRRYMSARRENNKQTAMTGRKAAQKKGES
ncbi:hypothetical protein ACQU0X_28915 [Pseudovibrio ascidiaceicola]|uniref:hypothetical protein n=1 Tax=Pseudovibrio ascidiaceicola TaxID=285279 RepID=UPI003D36DCC3